MVVGWKVAKKLPRWVCNANSWIDFINRKEEEEKKEEEEAEEDDKEEEEDEEGDEKRDPGGGCALQLIHSLFQTKYSILE
jgi:hypothetical protein